MNRFSTAAVHDPIGRLTGIARARLAVMHGQAIAPDQAPAGWVEPWIERSWKRCLARGQRPGERVVFDVISAARLRDHTEANQTLAHAAKPVLSQLTQTLAATRYFAVLTNGQGVVVSTDGPIDHSDPRAHSIARVGVDLSEQAVGTTAIGAALGECAPVWLHRGEHFYEANNAYSCAGAPIFSPDGRCAGMLDFTGIDAPERRELLSLAQHAARQIQNALLHALPHALLLHLRWPGMDGAGGSSAQVVVDAQGGVLGADPAARNMLGLGAGTPAVHLDELFATPSAVLWDAARTGQALELPLWSGLRVCVLAQRAGDDAALNLQGGLALRELEDNVIRRAVQTARGNVAQAAKALGISRATVYRKLNARR